MSGTNVLRTRANQKNVDVTDEFLSGISTSQTGCESKMEELADLYDGMYDAFVSLATDTMSCLGNMADCIESVDEQSAEAFSNDKDYSEGED